MSMHCHAGQFAGQPSRVALRLPPRLTTGGSAACIFGRRWHGFHEDGQEWQRPGIPFRGSVIWLTPAQGGRTTGNPLLPRPAWPYYAATAYVPPHTADTGLASFILRNFDPGAWRSAAEGRWLAAAIQGEQLVRPGSVIAVYRRRPGRRLLHCPPRSSLLTFPLRCTPVAARSVSGNRGHLPKRGDVQIYAPPAGLPCS